MFKEFPIRIGRTLNLHELQQQQQQQPHQRSHHKVLLDGVRGSCFPITFVTRPTGALAYLVFRNYYAASLSIEQQNYDGTTVVVLSDYRLMQSPQFEDDAQQWHLISFDKFEHKIDLAQLELLVFYLFQPCALWEKWELQHLKVYQAPSSPAPSAPLSSRPPSDAPEVPERSLRRLSFSQPSESKDTIDHATRVVHIVESLRALMKP